VYPACTSSGGLSVGHVRRTSDPAVPANEARLISYISYEMGTLTVLAVLTHKEYDKGGWKNACNC